MRGTRSSGWRSRFRWRIIPAYAGNTIANTVASPNPRDHPRVCGEHARRIYRRANPAGSSPRMRGTRIVFDWTVYDPGIIPAYAGNTRSQRVELAWRRDHPRVCGEHRPYEHTRQSTAGSSPRMRGTHADWLERRLSLGIIPAYAGNTSLARLSSCSRRDHPRVCGEHRLDFESASVT